MTRIKIFGITLVSIVLLIVAINYVSSRLLLQSFEEIENVHMVENLERIDSAIYNYRKTLRLQLADWAHWDDTYLYLQNQNEQYADSNLGVDTLVALEINYMAFINQSEDVIYAEGVDFLLEDTIPHEQTLQTIIEKTKLDNVATHDGISDVIKTQDGVIFVEVLPVTYNDGSGEYVGSLLFARILDDYLLDSISELTKSDIRIGIPGFEDFPEVMDYALLQIKETGDYVIEPIDNNVLKGFTAITGSNDTVLAIISTTIHREIYLQGQETIKTFTHIATGAILIFAISIILFFEKILLRRLVRLTKKVETIDVKKLPDVEIEESSFDEVGSLAKTINTLLKEITKAQADEKNARIEQIKANSELKKALEKSEKLNKLVVGREEKMVAMKEELKQLRSKNRKMNE